MLLEPPSTDSNELELVSDLIGQIGVTSGALRPSGHIVVDGNEYAALSNLGYIEPDVRVRIIGRKEMRLIVQRLEQGAP